jgi:hypothetical protein
MVIVNGRAMAGEMTPEDLAIEDRSDRRDPDDMIRYRMVTLERKLEAEYAGKRVRNGSWEEPTVDG